MCGKRQLTVQMIANKPGISCKTVWTIITENLGIKKIFANMVPCLWKKMIQVCHDILEQLKTELDLLRVVMGDEFWIFEYNLLNKRQSFQ